MRDIRYTPPGTRRTAAALFFLAVIVGAVLFRLLRRLPHGTLWAVIPVCLWAFAAYFGVRYIVTSFSYTLTEEVDGIPTLHVVRTAAGRITPCCHIPLADVIELLFLAQKQPLPPPAPGERTVNYVLSLRAAERQVLRVRQGQQVVRVVIEGNSAFASCLEQWVREARGGTI